MESADIEAIAAQWLVALKTGTAAEVKALWPEFHTWMNAAPEHRRVYLQLEKGWRRSRKQMIRTQRLGIGTGSESIEEVKASAVRCRAVYRRSLVGGAVVAGTLSASIAAFVWFTSWDRYETPYGGWRPVELADGSKIELNTNTKVRVHMTAREREIALDRGEALFEVAADKDRPFTVRVENEVLVAHGTEFAVRLDPDGVTDAYVSKGHVEVSVKKDPSPSGGGQFFLYYLDPGDAVTVRAGNPQKHYVGLRDIERRLAWKFGKIDVNGSLAEAVSEFNRYNTRRLTIEDRAIADLHVQGIYPATNPDFFAQKLKELYGIKVAFPKAADGSAGVIRLGGNS